MARCFSTAFGDIPILWAREAEVRKPSFDSIFRIISPLFGKGSDFLPTIVFGTNGLIVKSCAFFFSHYKSSIVIVLSRSFVNLGTVDSLFA